MELRHLRYFVAVAEERHFGRAATRLHMAQPPLSQQIRNLETELGVVLLRRTTRRVDLTAAGETYLVRAREILASVDEAGAEAGRVAEGLVGRVVIGCVGSATYSVLPALARTLRKELPGIDFAFRGEMLEPDQVAALLAGRIDLALLRPPVDDATLRLTTLRREPLIVALPQAHPLAARERLRVADLRDEELIVHVGQGRSVMHGLVTSLCRELDEKLVLPVKASSWSSKALGDILRSPRIAGLRVHRGEVVGEAQWPAIIDRETHEALVATSAGSVSSRAAGCTRRMCALSAPIKPRSVSVGGKILRASSRSVASASLAWRSSSSTRRQAPRTD